jgi:parvulin-like peptidyl-prolyl isomerase
LRWYSIEQPHYAGSRRLKHTITIGVAIAALVASSGCGGRGGKPIGRAFGEHISLDDLHNYMDTFGTRAEPSVRVRTGSGETNAQLAGSFKFQALREMMIRRAWIEMARSRGVAPTTSDIDKELTFRGHLSPGYLQEMTKEGLTMSRVKDLIEFDLAKENLLCEGVTVTAADATAFRAAHPKDFMDPETADLQWIFAKTQQRMQEVDKELEAGQDFGTVAREKSDAPGPAETKSQFRYTNVDQMDPQIQQIVHGTKENSASSKWVHFPKIGGWAKFYVVKVHPAKPADVNEYKSEELRRLLAEARGAMGKDLDEDVQDYLVQNRKDFVVEDNTLSQMWSAWLDDIAAKSVSAAKS